MGQILQEVFHTAFQEDRNDLQLIIWETEM